MVEQIKSIAKEFVYSTEDMTKKKFSIYLSSKLNKEYGYLSTQFSSSVGITLKQYLIKLKIERVKKMLVSEELPVSEIAWSMGYNSPAHLTWQFKKVTGLTPSRFRKLLMKENVIRTIGVKGIGESKTSELKS